ncbi:hypothetical protein BC829DRAFT_441086 [Chytridium lagenaria]|nr:hypothetical protein BC829DRAFT_441086 [Chytridium lagenaria]
MGPEEAAAAFLEMGGSLDARVEDGQVVPTALFLVKIPHVILCTYGYMKGNTLRVEPEVKPVDFL